MASTSKPHFQASMQCSTNATGNHTPIKQQKGNNMINYLEEPGYSYIYSAQNNRNLTTTSYMVNNSSTKKNYAESTMNVRHPNRDFEFQNNERSTSKLEQNCITPSKSRTIGMSVVHPTAFTPYGNKSRPNSGLVGDNYIQEPYVNNHH